MGVQDGRLVGLFVRYDSRVQIWRGRKTEPEQVATSSLVSVCPYTNVGREGAVTKRCTDSFP